LRVVIDTNIFMAGLLNMEGGAAKIIEMFRNGVFELVITREVFEEYLQVIHYFGNKIPPSKSEELLELILRRGKSKVSRFKGIMQRPDDEKFLSAAISGNAKYIVTKNKKDFPVKLTAVKIVNPKNAFKK